MVCQGCQHGLLHLDPQADISTVQAVGPQTSREEIRDLSYQVYKLGRVPGSPPCGPECMEELVGDVVSSLKNCLRQMKANHQKNWRSLDWQMSSLCGERPPGGGGGASPLRDIAETREAHQRAIATIATLEEKIERLSQSVTRGWLDACAYSWSCDCQKRRSWGQSRRHCRALPQDSPACSPEHSHPWWGPGAWEDKGAETPFDPGLPPELGPDVNHFLQELASSAREDSRHNSSPEPPVYEYER